jgi:DNA-binding NarL/FixJ family response regulator
MSGWPDGFDEKHGWYTTLAEEHCTERQLEILQATAAGVSSRDIAAKLGISRSSVRDHLRDATHRIKKARDQQRKEQAA